MNYTTRTGYKPRPLFIDQHGRTYDAGTIAYELRARGLANLRGRHITAQLSALGLYEAFLLGTTPWPLPFSIWS